MKKETKANRRNPPIKGYLPIRIELPPVGGKDDRHTFTSFIYIKEHAQTSQQGSNGILGGSGGATLFIANAPANGPIRTDLFLRALLEPYGDIIRVTVAQDPRRVGSSSSAGEEEAVEMFREAALTEVDAENATSFGRTRRGDGKFAHVVFSSSKEMKNAIKMLNREMSAATDVFAMRLGDEMIDRLKMETAQLSSNENHDDDDDVCDEEALDHSLTGIHAIAAQSRQKAGRHISRQKLMQMCNDAMASFESEEEEAARRAKLAGDQPDEDGFVTVTHKSTPSFGAANDMEEELHHRRKAGKRNRKRKGGSGADELSDFYRFQMKETRKKEAHDLKKRFEEDLAKVKKMKEDRAYRPF
jgi:ribosomal RNA-processing protein 7